MEREEREQEEEVSRSELITREGKKLILIRWNTGKTSASRLFGRYGGGGRPEFFRLLFGAVAGSLREQLGQDGEGVFGRIRDSEEFRRTSKELFESMKRWFFEEIVPKYKLERGDIFMVITELELDPDTGRLTWNKDKTEFYYWVRSDRCGEIGMEELERLRRENEELRRELSEVKEKLEKLARLLK